MMSCLSVNEKSQLGGYIVSLGEKSRALLQYYVSEQMCKRYMHWYETRYSFKLIYQIYKIAFLIVTVLQNVLTVFWRFQKNVLFEGMI